MYSNGSNVPWRPMQKVFIQKKVIKMWNEWLDEFSFYKLGNVKGQTCTFEENKIILLAVKMCLNFYIHLVNEKVLSIHQLN